MGTPDEEWLAHEQRLAHQRWDLRGRRWRQAVDELRARAVACGCDPDQAISRLHQSSFVSTRHRFAYVETPKCASTTLKHVIAALEDVNLSALDEAVDGYASRQEMNIHVRHLLRIPGLLDVDACDRSEILDRRPRWFAFAVVRNPYARLVSVFESKVRLGEPNYRALEARYGDNGAFSDVTEAFRAYVAEVVASPAGLEADHHLSPMVDYLMPRLFDFVKVFRFERMGELFGDLQAHLDSLGQGRIVRQKRLNSGPKTPWRPFYDRASAEIVASRYRQDFEAYGYDPEDWRPTEREDFAETEISRYWRAEVVKRNALIEDLYRKLAGRSA